MKVFKKEKPAQNCKFNIELHMLFFQKNFLKAILSDQLIKSVNLTLTTSISCVNVQDTYDLKLKILVPLSFNVLLILAIVKKYIPILLPH